MVSAADVQATARGMVGTPFRHQGRRPGRGLDCAGVVIETARALGLAFEDWRAYSRYPDGRTLERILDRCLERAPEPTPGGVLLFRFDALPQHVAVATERRGLIYLVHSYSRIGRVVEHRLDERWQACLVRAYRWEGVA
ncbi:MAG: peptidase P60 [Thiohalorhabdus sp.]|uniref:peptidase P60 n=1 Tax=Thiohalorhabdus sp. TaxID=3094134 RepID=UPI0039807552